MLRQMRPEFSRIQRDELRREKAAQFVGGRVYLAPGLELGFVFRV